MRPTQPPPSLSLLFWGRRRLVRRPRAAPTLPSRPSSRRGAAMQRCRLPPSRLLRIVAAMGSPERRSTAWARTVRSVPPLWAWTTYLGGPGAAWVTGRAPAAPSVNQSSRVSLPGGGGSYYSLASARAASLPPKGALPPGSARIASLPPPQGQPRHAAGPATAFPFPQPRPLPVPAALRLTRVWWCTSRARRAGPPSTTRRGARAAAAALGRARISRG